LDVGEAVSNTPAADDIDETVRLGVGIVRELRESVARTRRDFEDELAEGVEARSFSRSCSPLLPVTEECIRELGRLLEALAGTEGTAGESFVAELRLLEKEYITFRELLAEALARASEAPRPVDWDRLKQESDADFAAGRFVTFETHEDVRKGLGCDD
jgi:hypothetical protein